MSQPSPWWKPGRHSDRRPFLTARGRIKTAIRDWFLAEGFQEVEPGCLQVSPGNETHLHAFRTELVGTDLQRRDRYLHTSPEFAMKKLLAAGETKIFAFAPVFRNRERGALHAPEFTMLEWYRVDEPYETLWADCDAIVKIAAKSTGHTPWTFRGKTCDPLALYDWTTLYQAFAQFVEIPLHEAMGDRDALARLAEAQNIRTAPDDTWSDVFSRVLTEKIEPWLGLYRPEVLCRYPIEEAALARPDPEDPLVAERFELYCCGVELANGFGELTDAAEQRRRFEEQMAAKERIYGERIPIDEDFLAALAEMPPACGCALGFDRLVMLATGAERVDQVIWTPMEGETR
ncbi:EF-P lysine aminoacylase GenX [Hyphomicrobium methylovorum]|uniref:EF-P lysine aminoacylase EpmA n=1 Tax=Hyphomicrobium methylovorum TaxID=84 RepID=UPI0015E70280|nr:EF-P lysine aminoacylase EpmA [Hyphomicrobium methylovorum]MBA2127679.1 EF-P lysine aminoacylase GenX [Hyphomicrobium methylovorum]